MTNTLGTKTITHNEYIARMGGKGCDGPGSMPSGAWPQTVARPWGLFPRRRFRRLISIPRGIHEAEVGPNPAMPSSEADTSQRLVFEFAIICDFTARTMVQLMPCSCTGEGRFFVFQSVCFRRGDLSKTAYWKSLIPWEWGSSVLYLA